MAWDASKAFGEHLGIAVRATRTDFRAAPDRIPGGVGPFNSGVFAHRSFANRQFVLETNRPLV